VWPLSAQASFSGNRGVLFLLTRRKSNLSGRNKKIRCQISDSGFFRKLGVT